MQRLRVRYAKRGRLRFSSHRDIQRALERALRRAEVPMAYSQGFSPHPRISYANSAATGAASEAEYVELALVQPRDPDQLRAALDSALPPGLDVLDVVEAGPGALADRLVASTWTVRLAGVAPATLDSALTAFLAADEVLVERLFKTGLRTFDARAAVVLAGVSEPASGTNEPPCAILHMVVRHGTPSVRPDDVLAGLRRVADLEPPLPPLVTRLAQGPLDPETGAVADPLAPDRDAARTRAASAGEPGPAAGG